MLTGHQPRPRAREQSGQCGAVPPPRSATQAGSALPFPRRRYPLLKMGLQPSCAAALCCSPTPHPLLPFSFPEAALWALFPWRPALCLPGGPSPRPALPGAPRREERQVMVWTRAWGHSCLARGAGLGSRPEPRILTWAASAPPSHL